MTFADASYDRTMPFASRQDAYSPPPLRSLPSDGGLSSFGQFENIQRNPRRAAAPPPARTTRASRYEPADPTRPSSNRPCLDDGGRYHCHDRPHDAAAVALHASTTHALVPLSPSGSTSSSTSTSNALVTSKKPRKTNSERGKAFRARRKQQEAELLAMVGSLRKEVVDLDFLHSLRREVSLRRRNSLQGSLVRIALQYFDVFADGAAAVALVPGKKRVGGVMERAAQQEAFLRSAMDPEMQFGALMGWRPLLEQWRRYTTFHASISTFVTGVEVVGPEESPVVTVRSDLNVVFSRDTFAHVFPHAAHDEALVRKFCGRRVTYKGVNRLQFSADAKVVNYDADVGFVDALVAAGATIQDLALIMDDARIVDQCQLGDEPDRVILLQDEDADGADEDEAGNNQEEDQGDARPETKRSRFDVEYLLS